MSTEQTGQADRPTAPTNADGVEVWDLRTPPTASDVKMPEGQNYVAYSSKDPREVLVRLPSGRELRLRATLVAFDNLPGSIASPGEKPRDPTGMDFRTAPLPLADAVSVMLDSMRDLGIASGTADRAAAQWRDKIGDRPRSGPGSTLPVSGGGGTDLGYLDIGVGGSYDPEADRAIIKYRANWGTARGSAGESPSS